MGKHALLILLLAVSLFSAGCLNYFVSPPDSPGKYNPDLEASPFSILPNASSNITSGPNGTNANSSSPGSPTPVFPGATPTDEQGAQDYKIDAALSRNFTSFSYDEVISMNGIDMDSARVFVKGNKTRRESMGGWGEYQSNMVTLIDSENGTVYFLNSEQKTASRLSDPNPQTYAQGAKIEGKETYLGTRDLFGVPTEVYEYSNPSSSETVTAWVWKEKGIILKMQVDTQYGSAVIQAKNVTFADFSDSIFQVPPGFVVKDVAAPPLN
ncbi:Uncharacterised protein [Candidatus Gugararchaeum adminiculabundum]|nr:Uncharacterised protein [Candidatus Gugararchaeum adminiculabundum]